MGESVKWDDLSQTSQQTEGLKWDQIQTDTPMPEQPEPEDFYSKFQRIMAGMPRAAALGARSLLHGAGGAVEFIGTPLKLGVEAATGKPVGLASTVEQGLEKVGIDVPTPETPTERVVDAGTQMLAAGGGPLALADKAQKLAKAGSVAQKAIQGYAANPTAQLTSAASSGVAGQTAAEMGADPTTQLGVSLATGLVAPKAPSAVMKGKDVSKAFMSAHKLGYKIPPSLVKPSLPQRFTEGALAGSAVTRQTASYKNQHVTNSLIKKDIGYSKDMPLTPEGLDHIRAQAGTAYEKVKKIGRFFSDGAYHKALDKAAKIRSAMAQDFPEAVNKDIQAEVKKYAKKSMSAEGVVEAVKQLRDDASRGFGSQDPAIAAMSRAKGKVADALEHLMERQASKTPEFKHLVPDLRKSRKLIAKTYTIQKALKGENVDARKLGNMLDKGDPLSGLTREVGNFGRRFKGAAAVPEGGVQASNFRVTDALIGAGFSAGTSNPAYMALMAARPALRTAILSKPYQSMLAKARPQEMRKIMQLPKEARAVQSLALYHQLQEAGQVD